MNNDVIASKLIVDVANGETTRAVLIYKITDGASIGKQKTIAVSVSRETLNTIIAEAIASAKTSEGIV
jgi:hypothetical protein